MLHRTDRSKNHGFTLMELAIVMGVIGSVLGAIWWATGNAKELARQNSAVNELQTVSQNIVNLYGGRTFSTSACDTGSTFPCTITKAMITAQVIPSTYMNTTNNAKADNPWSTQGFQVWVAATAQSYRLSFYNVSRSGCMALLSQGTSCQAGQTGCPTGVVLGGKTSAFTSTTACTSGVNCLAVPATGWQNMTSTAESTLCAANSYTGGNNSVEFDYSL